MVCTKTKFTGVQGLEQFPARISLDERAGSILHRRVALARWRRLSRWKNLSTGTAFSGRDITLVDRAQVGRLAV